MLRVPNGAGLGARGVLPGRWEPAGTQQRQWELPSCLQPARAAWHWALVSPFSGMAFIKDCLRSRKRRVGTGCDPVFDYVS